MMNRFIVLLAVLGFSSAVYAQKNVKIKFLHQYDSQAFVIGQDYTDGQGRVVNFSRAEFYLSELELVHDGGQTMDLSSEYQLVRPNVSDHDLGMRNITTFEGINYSLGVDSATNHADPSLYPIDHPLALQNPSMHWGWASGYRFLVLDGMVDTDNDNIPDTGFEMHVVGDEYLRNVSVTTSGDLNGNNLDIYIIVDYSGWVETLDLATVGSLHGGGPTIEEVMNNTNDYNVFTAPLNVDVATNVEAASYIFTDYTYPADRKSVV